MRCFAAVVQPSVISRVGYVQDALVLSVLSDNALSCNYNWYHNTSRYNRCDNSCNCSFESLRAQDAGVYEVVYLSSDNRSNITGAFMTLAVLGKIRNIYEGAIHGWSNL